MARAAHKKLAELVYGQKEELNSLNIQRATLNTKLNSLRSEHSLEAISVNLNKLSEQFSSYKNEYKNISDKLSNLNRAEATLNAFIKSNGERAALLTEKLKTSENNLKSEEDRLQVTLSDAMKVKIGKDEIADYGTKTKEFFESLGQIKSSLVEIDHQMSAFDEELRNLKVNELNDKLTDVEDSLSKTNHDLSELMEAKGGLVEEISSLISAKEKYEALLSKFEDSEKHYRKISFVSKAVSGNNEMKLNLSRYALAIIFDEILEKATEILYTTSKGRYLLLRSDNHADKRKSFGLDLEVFDEHTGQKRPVNTLSGGESFIASLSLALGLSEVVKATNGGLRLDMLFIDEGFGSLDSDSLARALEALKDVGAVASVVGIITHVSEIKEEIPARIEVIPSVSGSTLSYTLPNVGG